MLDRFKARRTTRTLAGFMGGLVLLVLTAQLRAVDDPTDRPPEEVFANVIGPDVKAGFNLRSDTWNGNLPTGETKPIRHQFFKGNNYHFYVSTDVHGAKVSVHIYDKDGNLAEDRAWQRENKGTFFAGAEIAAKSSGSFFLIVKVDESPAKETAWEMAYSYK